MKQSPAVYPANVLGDTQNRQQIATVLQSMGFETDDIAKAFNVFEKSYGDKKYDISILTEIVFQIQQNEEAHNQYNEYKDNKIENAIKSHSAPNSPQLQIQNPNQIQNQQILHYQHINNNNNMNNIQQQPLPPPNNNNNNSNEMLSIFNSLQMNASSDNITINNNNNNNNNMNRLKSGKALSASPQLQSHYTTAKLNLLECLNSFARYASDENEIIEVLLQTLNNNSNNSMGNDNDVFNNMVNWNDLFSNIKQRKYEWNKFKQGFNSNVIFTDYDTDRHMQIQNSLNKHKSNKKHSHNNNMNENNALNTPQIPNPNGFGNNNNNNNKESLLKKALQFQYDLKNMDLLNKKDKLLVTANTYSILKNNKQKTELMIEKCNEKMSELDVKILELQNEKKQYFSALMRTKNKLLFQIQSIRDTEKSIKTLHEQTSKIQNEILSINKTKKCVNTFENQLKNITNVLKYNFNKRLEPMWSTWSNTDVIIWIQHIENEKYSNSIDLTQIKESAVCGNDLPQMNDFILRSFRIMQRNDRDLILKNIKRVTLLKQYKHSNNMSSNNNNISQKNMKSSKKKKSQLCVVCSDGEANHIMIPCGHIAVCSNCVQQVKQYKKCAFCGNKITNVIKCFHVGF